MTSEATQGPVKTYEIIVDAIHREIWRVAAPDAETAQDSYLEAGTFLGTDPSGDYDARPEIVAVRCCAEIISD